MPTSLLDLLQQQYDQLVQMDELLVCERDAMTSRLPEKVVAITEQKAAQLKQLQHTDSQISTLYQQDDFKDPEVSALKKAIDTLLGDIKKQNDVNGIINQNNQMTVKMLKGILFDSKKDQSSMTYNQLGQKTAASRYKPIKA